MIGGPGDGSGRVRRSFPEPWALSMGWYRWVGRVRRGGAGLSVIERTRGRFSTGPVVNCQDRIRGDCR